MKTKRADDYISAILESRNRELGNQIGSDVVAIKSPIRFGLDAVIRHELENLHEGLEESKRPKRLCVVIETTGGQIEAVERIYNVFRRHYEFVSFVVPSEEIRSGDFVLAGAGEDSLDLAAGRMAPEAQVQELENNPLEWKKGNARDAAGEG